MNIVGRFGSTEDRYGVSRALGQRAHDLEIVGRVRTASACPAGSEARRLGDDAVIDCVVEGPAGPSVGP